MQVGHRCLCFNAKDGQSIPFGAPEGNEAYSLSMPQFRLDANPLSNRFAQAALGSLPWICNFAKRAKAFSIATSGSLNLGFGASASGTSGLPSRRTPL